MRRCNYVAPCRDMNHFSFSNSFPTLQDVLGTVCQIHDINCYPTIQDRLPLTLRGNTDQSPTLFHFTDHSWRALLLAGGGEAGHLPTWLGEDRVTYLVGGGGLGGSPTKQVRGREQVTHLTAG